MTERIQEEQEYFQSRPSPDILSGHQYSRKELITLSKSPASARRPKCLEQVYDSDDGKWDPERWYKAKFGLARQASPLTLGDGKDQRKVVDRDKDLKRRSSTNDPVERLKEERDGIVLSPQRRSFGTGCHVQMNSHSYTRQLSLPDREEGRVEREREKERDRERPVRKIGSGRLQVDRENNREYPVMRDHFDDRDHSRDHERDRDYARNRDRDRNWDRDARERDLHDSDWDRDGRDREQRDSDRERRFDRSERFRRGGERDFADRDWGQRIRSRGFDRHSRKRNNHRDGDKEPEWFTGGPTSQTDTIELRGFDREEDNGGGGEDIHDKILDVKVDIKSRIMSPDEKPRKGSYDETSEPAVKVSLHRSSEPSQQVQQSRQQEQQKVSSQRQQDEDNSASSSQHNSRMSPSSKLFDFEEILNAILPLDENGVRHRSRFSDFFSGPGGNVLGGDTSLDDMFVPCDGNHSGRTIPSPTSYVGSAGVIHHAHLGMHHFQAQDGEQTKSHTFSRPHHLLSMPNSAGDNNAASGKTSLPPSVTALFNSAALGSSNACKWNPHLDCSVETPESSFFTNSAISSSSSFSTHDAEVQLKAMLFGGNRDSTSSSGTASPANLPPGAHRKAKTVAELEADMHQSSPRKMHSPNSMTSIVENQTNSGDVTAFNKLLIMINAASEANQNTIQTEHQASHVGYGMIPSHNEFNHAVMRNKEKQMQLLQRSLQNSHQPVQLSSGLSPQLPQHNIYSHLPPSHEQQPLLSHQHAQSVAYHQFQQQLAYHNANTHADMMKPPNTPGLPQALSPNTPGLPQAMSTPNTFMKLRTQNGGSVDPIFSLIQQNPTIIMNPASPAPHMATMMAPQQTAASNTARVPSPLIFNQQPPLHLSAPSPIHPGQMSPRSMTLGANLTPSALSTPTGMRSPVLPRVLSPQELSAHAQAVMQSALIKKQLQDQNERYLKKQQERAKSPSLQQINVVKPQPAAQMVIPPTPQPKGASLDTFTPTSVLRRMHSDKAVEKEKQASETRKDDEIEFMPSMHDLNAVGHADLHNDHPHDGVSRKSDTKLMGDLSDISFLEPVNPNLVAMMHQLENQLRIGQTNVLPGPLSQPMSVEEKMRLSALAEKPGYLSQMLDKAAAAAETARAHHGRPVFRAEDSSQEARNLHHFLTMQQLQHPPTIPQSGRPVTGSGINVQPSLPGSAGVQPGLTQYSSMQQNTGSRPITGRAIVGGSSACQPSPAQNIDVLRMLEHHHHQQQQIRHMQLMPNCQGMVLPPPPLGTPISCLGPPPLSIPVSARGSLVGEPPNTAMMHQQMVRANAINAQRQQHISQMMSIQHSQQHLNLAPLPPLHTVMSGVSPHLNAHSQVAGSLSPAALSATIQRIASPHGALKMNGPLQQSAVNVGGLPKVDLTSGIQRWFSPDILRTQLPSMPPLPTHGTHVITVDELERN